MICLMDDNMKHYCFPYDSVMFIVNSQTNAIDFHTTFGVIFHNDDALTVLGANNQPLGNDLDAVKNELADILR